MGDAGHVCMCVRAEVRRQKERSWSTWASTVCAATEQSIDDAGTLSVDGTFYREYILYRTHAVGGVIRGLGFKA
jgi:hypothetical protein